MLSCVQAKQILTLNLLLWRDCEKKLWWKKVVMTKQVRKNRASKYLICYIQCYLFTADFKLAFVCIIIIQQQPGEKCNKISKT